MTVKQFIAMIGEVETGGFETEGERQRAIGDGGQAGGFYQQHWVWRVDYWPAWAWALLRVLDAIGIENFCAKHAGESGRDLADRYNFGRLDPDPGYEQMCRNGLAKLGIPESELETIVKD